MRQETAVVFDGTMHHRHADVQEQAVGVGVGQDLQIHVPAVIIKVIFEKMVKASVATNLEFRAHPKTGAVFFGLFNGLQDAVAVAFEIKCPLVEVAGGECDVVAHGEVEN